MTLPLGKLLETSDHDSGLIDLGGEKLDFGLRCVIACIGPSKAASSSANLETGLTQLILARLDHVGGLVEQSFELSDPARVTHD